MYSLDIQPAKDLDESLFITRKRSEELKQHAINVASHFSTKSEALKEILKVCLNFQEASFCSFKLGEIFALMNNPLANITLPQGKGKGLVIAIGSFGSDGLSSKEEGEIDTLIKKATDLSGEQDGD